MLTQQLTAIEAAGLATVAQTQPELVYSFRHALIQEAAYASLTRHQRARLHRTVGEALEQVYAGRLDEFAGVLAYHFATAREVDRAVAYSLQAARAAVQTYSYDEARQLLRSALALLDPGDLRPERLALLEALADVSLLLREGREAVTLYQQALDLWEHQGGADQVMAIRLHRKLVRSFAEVRWSMTAGEFDERVKVAEASRASLLAGLEWSEGQAPHPETARLLVALARHAWNIQTPPDWGASLQYAQGAARMAEQLGAADVQSAALGALATAHFGNGQLLDYRDTALRRVAVTRGGRLENVREMVDALRDAGSAHMYAGEYHAALAVLKEAEGEARRIRALDQLFNVLILKEQCWLHLDRWDEVLRIEAEWTALAGRVDQERLGLDCFAVALGATVRALRGEMELARSRRQTSYDLMITFTGPPEGWFRNQHY